MSQLYPHQVRALDGLKRSILAGHRRPMLQAPTGSGKTVLAAAIVTGALAKGKRVAFCVPTLGLVDQTFDRFGENGIRPLDMGVIQGDHQWRRPEAPVQICSAQTLARRGLPTADIVMIDEAHTRFEVYETWMGSPEAAGTIFIGLSATPWTKGLGRQFDALVKMATIAELIDGGYLSRFRVFAPSRPDLEGVRTVAGDYHEGDLAERMNRPQLTADIVATWLARGDNQPTLCFATGREHAKALAEQFAGAGVPSAYIDGNTPRDERSAIGRQLVAGGALKVVVNIGCLTKGIDWDVRCLILARPTKSESLFVQIVGRALRTADGKDHAIILDHSDTHMRLGLVTGIDHDALCDGKPGTSRASKAKTRKDLLPKCCPACAAIMPLLTRECPSCGHTMPHRAPEVADGDLREIGTAKSKEPSVKDQIKQLGKQQVFAMLTVMARDAGRKEGWTAHTYREIFGVWPRGLSPEPIAPHPIVRSYVRHKAIRFAKSRAVTAEVAHVG